MAVSGIGLGMGQQILALIVQNSFPNSVVGTATAATNYFRQVGASVGSAIVGSLTPAAVAQLPDALRTPIIESYSEALLPIFLFMVPLIVAESIAEGQLAEDKGSGSAASTEANR